MASPRKSTSSRKPGSGPSRGGRKPASNQPTLEASSPNAAKGSSRPLEHDDPAAVAAFIEAMAHPLTPVLDAVRKAILKIDGAITAGIKWNCPSFYLNGWFATLNIRKDQVFLVLHQGVKTRKDSTIRTTVLDPDGLLTWHAPDRASLTFESDAAFRKHRKAFDALLTAWTREQRQS